MSDINFITGNRRRNLLMGGIIGALSVSAVLGGTLLLNGSSRPLTASIGDMVGTPTPVVSGSVKPVASNMPRPLSDTPANSLARGTGSDTVRYYEALTGRAFQVDLQSHKVSILSDKKLPGFVRTIWNPRGNDVVSMFSRSAGTVFQYFNYDTKQSTVVGSPATSVAFSPDGTSTVFLETGTHASALYIGKSDGSEPRKILETRLTDAVISWPLENTVALVSQHGTTTTRDVTFVGADGSLSAVLSTLENLELTWSADGRKVLYSYFEPANGVRLWYMDTAERLGKPLNIETSAQKCGWDPDTTTIVCGIPSNTNLSRDTSSANSATLDDIYRINVLTGEQKKIYSAQREAHIGIIDPLVSSSGSFLVFTNLFDQRLYSIPLE